MKNISLLLIGLIYCLHALCQQGQSKSVIDTTITNGMEQLSEQSFTTISHQQFDRFSGTLIGYSYYRKDNMLFYYRNDASSRFDKFTLEVNMNQFVKSHKDAGHPVTRSEIITVNGIRFLIIAYAIQTDKFISYRSEDNNSGKFTYGYIQYKSQEENNAQQLLKDVLQTIHLNNL
jgi:hypothetical protein